MKKANATLPAAFAKLFKGEPNGPFQNLCRDLKLMDAVFRVAAMPYAQATIEAEPLSEEEKLKVPMPFDGATAGSEVMVGGPKAIQKFAHVMLQCMVNGNAKNQAYFGKRQLLNTDGDEQTEDGKPHLWMDSILFQLDDPLGGAVTLSALLSSSADLMQKYATPQLVLRFANMVERLGPQPRLIQFFSAISSVNGNPVKANQEMILRLIWMKEETRRKVMLQLRSFPDGSEKAGPSVKAYPPMKDFKGKSIDGQYSAAEITKFPPKFIGRPLVDGGGGFPAVFVTWDCGDDWKGNAPLFWGPNKMGPHASSKRLDFYDGDGDGASSSSSAKGGTILVRIEDFSWVLEKERLCLPVTGRPWAEVKQEIDDDVDGAAARFKQQTQLASYFVSQLAVLSNMVGMD